MTFEEALDSMSIAETLELACELNLIDLADIIEQIKDNADLAVRY